MFLGIEIGGTKLQLGVGAGDGILAALWRGSVDRAAGAAGIRRQILTAVPELLSRAGLDRSRIRGVGIGFGGPVDDATRAVIKSHHIEGWDNFRLADWISDLLGWPAVLGNDADVAGLAEALFGAGKGLSPIFYITIGSGIGGGLIIDGEIYRGCGRGAAEIGHLSVNAAALPGPPGFHGCVLEHVASGWGIERTARMWAANPAVSGTRLVQLVNGETDRITARQVAQAAAEGDEFALSILLYAWNNLAQAMAQVVKLLCPKRFIIGGGVSQIGEELLFKHLRGMVQAHLDFPPFADCYDIVPAALGEEVVVHGAVALARKKLA